MREQLAAYGAGIDDFERFRESLMGTTAKIEKKAEALRRREHTVKEILRRFDPNLASFDFEEKGGIVAARRAVQRGLGAIDSMDELARGLAPDAPTLTADQLHSWVWGAARSFWDSKHYRAAAEAAAGSITARTQTKVGRRDVADADLMNQVFTDQPKAGQVYLRLPGNPNDRTIKSRNRALRPYAEGCYAGMRNPATHEDGDDWDPQYAFEVLASLSVLARWIDECEVLTGA